MTDLVEFLPDHHSCNLMLDEQWHPRAELESATSDACFLQRINLRDARLNGVVFRDCNLTGALLAGANLFGATFERCKLVGVDLTARVLFQTDLRGSTLGGWHLRRTDLSGIIVTPAQMRELALEVGILVIE